MSRFRRAQSGCGPGPAFRRGGADRRRGAAPDAGDHGEPLLKRGLGDAVPAHPPQAVGSLPRAEHGPGPAPEALRPDVVRPAPCRSLRLAPVPGSATSGMTPCATPARSAPPRAEARSPETSPTTAATAPGGPDQPDIPTSAPRCRRRAKPLRTGAGASAPGSVDIAKAPSRFGAQTLLVSIALPRTPGGRCGQLRGPAHDGRAEVGRIAGAGRRHVRRHGTCHPPPADLPCNRSAARAGGMALRSRGAAAADGPVACRARRSGRDARAAVAAPMRRSRRGTPSVL